MSTAINNRTPVFYLLFVNTLLIVSVSIVSIVFQNVYSGILNTISLHELMGQDIFKILTSIVLLVSLIFMNKDSIKTKILWLGCLSYFMYIYAYYCFSIVSGIFFIMYIIIASISFFCIIFLIADILKQNTIPAVNKKYIRKSVSILLISCAGIMIGIEIMDIVVKTIIQPGGFILYDAYYLLDMIFVFPSMIIVGVLNWQKKIWGNLFAGVLLIKVITLLPAVIIGDVLHWCSEGFFIDLSFDIFSLVITAFSGIFLFFYWRGVEDK